LLAAPVLLGPLWAKDLASAWRPWIVGAGLALMAALAVTVPFFGWGLAPRPGRALYWLPPILVVVAYPWILWPALWRSATRRLWRLDEDGLRLCGAASLAAFGVIAAAGNADVGSTMVLLPPAALAAARLVVAQDPKPRDFHATLAGMPVLLVGFVLFLFNIIPVAHLDALWQRLTGGETALPIWLGGSSLFGGLALLGGGFVLAQLAPRDLLARALQVALLPALLAATLNVEFVVSLRRFFDVEPLAAAIHDLQGAGRPVAVLGAYGGEFDFIGRLDRPLARLADERAAVAWAAERPDRVIIAGLQGSLLHLPARPLRLGPAGDDWAALWSSAAVRETGGAALRRRF
jgi:uncharacterized protein YjeT (DUF2065 family)